MEVNIQNYIDNLTEVTAEKERISTELNVATRIQAGMLPVLFPKYSEREDFEVYASMDPAKEVGGDFYDFFFIDRTHLALVVADVSGKGVPAALFMVIAKTLIKNRTLAGGTPGEILTDVNNQLAENNRSDMFVTAFLAILNLETGEVETANAGHEYPAVRRADGSFELIVSRHNIALAAIDGCSFTTNKFQFNEGDSVFLYTDGVTEATDKDKQLFGNARLIEALNKEPDANPGVLLKNVRGAIDDFVGDEEQFDDITMISFKLKKLYKK
jgi:Serine phosphatase RsbU, regulator of sigma subunit